MTKKKEIIKVFFDSEFAASKIKEENNKRIISLLNKHCCNVIQTVMGVELLYLDKHGSKATNNIYSSKLKDIREVDACVYEMSSVSATLVFEIFEALKERKPVLVLSNKQKQYDQDIALLGNLSDLLFFETYKLDSLEEIIVQFVKKARRKIPISRFTVRLPKELDDYINFLKAKMKCSSKNDVILKILEERKKEDYGFLESQDLA